MKRLFLVPILVTTIVFSCFASSASAKKPCEVTHELSASFSFDSNINYLTYQDPDKYYTRGYSGEAECERGKNTTYDFELSYEESDISDDDFGYFDLGFDFKHYMKKKDWIQLEASKSKNRTFSDAGYTDVESIIDDWTATYGRPTSKKTETEIYYGESSSDYALFDSSVKDEDYWGVKVSYNTGGYTYIDLEYERTDAYYPSYESVIAYDSVNYETYSTGRNDDRSAFTATLSKTYSIYPLKYLQISAEKTHSSSDSSQYGYISTYDLFNNYEGYDELALSAYYVRDLTDRFTLSVYLLYDRTDYSNHPVGDYYTDYTITDNLVYKMKYYYGGLSYIVKKNQTMDLSLTYTDNDSNNSAYVYKKKVYTIGYTFKM